MRRVLVLHSGLMMVLGLAALWIYGSPAFRHFKEVRALEQANSFLAKQDYRQASLSARAVLVANPVNLEATRILCGLSERARAPQALDWRRRIVELAPIPENKLQLADAALRLEPAPFALAAETLNELSNSPPLSAQFHLVCAELCLKLNNFQEAERQFESALRLEPTNELCQLNLSVLRLASSNQLVAVVARAELGRLRSHEIVGRVALRWLVADAIKREDFSAATALARELLQMSASTVDDRLQYLSVLRNGRDPGFEAELRLVQATSSTNAVAIYMTAGWMLKHGLLDEAWEWVERCPVETRSQQPAPIAVVDCLMARKDWSRLESHLAAEKWGELDFLRLGFVARALAEQKREVGSEAMWRSAVRASGYRLGPLAALLEMARNGGSSKDAEDLLWQIANRFPREKSALRELERAYMLSGNTRGLNKVFSTRVQYESTNFVAKNNFAATSLLLKQDLANAHTLAKAVHSTHPEDPVVAATYAFSLHLQGRTREGLELLEQSVPESLEKPSVALYYGVLLSACGDVAKAAKYFEKAKDSPTLPEEKALLRAGKGS